MRMVLRTNGNILSNDLSSQLPSHVLRMLVEKLENQDQIGGKIK